MYRFRERRRAVVACREAQTTTYAQQRAIEVRSLENATLTVLPPLDGPKPPAGFAMLDLHSEEPLPWTFDGSACRAEGATGDVLVLW
ncbi:hypothetical protein [Cohnella fermenti]|uniref:Uncharacterized protein n=1 Tax=Cohnella fermenti TaxID=2565925 RepID=A0A4S4C626_9BACL|nr:hypothetical protein [Cohnella fermenti]THF83323.1 hypothetical protein E6C55_05590 [Cohnella fermenti]